MGARDVKDIRLALFSFLPNVKQDLQLLRQSEDSLIQFVLYLQLPFLLLIHSLRVGARSLFALSLTRAGSLTTPDRGEELLLEEIQFL